MIVKIKNYLSNKDGFWTLWFGSIGLFGVMSGGIVGILLFLKHIGVLQ